MPEQKIQRREKVDALLQVKRDGVSNAHILERIRMLGIPEAALTTEVRFAITAILEKLDDVTHELTRTKNNLAELEQLVDVDCLAPIPNRRAFMRRLNWAVSMLKRYQHPATILYFDLNNFKQINDTYGHAAGDLAIRHVSQILSNTMRDSDFIGRIGGDEFAIIMHHANEEQATVRANKIVEAIRNTPFNFNGEPIYLSAALGVYQLQEMTDADTALAAADFAMYVDKRKTRENASSEVAA